MRRNHTLNVDREALISVSYSCIVLGKEDAYFSDAKVEM
jgi:hypothetical protein